MKRWLLRASLTLAAVAAGAVLWSWSGREVARQAPVIAGPLFTFTADQVEAVEIRRVAGTTRLQRDQDGLWHLVGLVTDLADQDRADHALATLVAGDGFEVLAGTRPDERRFGFGGENAIELVFLLHGGGRQRLALGDVNPVSDLVYASGAGRPGVFSVGGLYYTTVARLPDSVRLPTLLRPLRAADLDSLRLDRRGAAPLVFARHGDERWWLRPPGGLADLAGPAARFHALHADRRLERPDGVWLLADVRRVRDMVFRVSDTAIALFPDPGLDAASFLDDLGLEPPYRALTLFAAADTQRVEFGEMRQESGRATVPARRQGSLVIARGEALPPLEGPLSEFLELGALSFRSEAADSFRVDEPARPLLWARRLADAGERRQPGRRLWEAVVPRGWRLRVSAEVAANQLADLQTNLDRLESLALLDPAPTDPLRPDERWRLRSWLPQGRFHEVWLGRLAETGQPAVWQPADGQCALVPEVILITLRNLRLSMEAEGAR